LKIWTPLVPIALAVASYKRGWVGLAFLLVLVAGGLMKDITDQLDGLRDRVPVLDNDGHVVV
jgi:hypothetical protein